MHLLSKFILFLLITITSFSLFGQQKITTYYDSLNQHINTVYFIINNDSNKIDGPFKKYHRNGVLEAEGQFMDGGKRWVIS